MTGLAALCLAAALGAALVLLLAARASGWRHRQIAILVRPWLLAIWIILTVGLSAQAVGGVAGVESADWVLFAGWLAVSLLVHAVDRRHGQPSHAIRRWGSRIAHIGVGVAVLGLVLSSAFTTDAKRLMEPGDRVRFNAWTIELHEVWPAAGEGWAGVTAELRASSGGGVVLLEPQLRSDGGRLPRSPPFAVASGTGRLSATIGARGSDGRWPIQLTRTPLLVLIPLGGVIAAIGGAVAMVGPPILRRRRLRRARLATAWWA